MSDCLWLGWVGWVMASMANKDSGQGEVRGSLVMVVDGGWLMVTQEWLMKGES